MHTAIVVLFLVNWSVLLVYCQYEVPDATVQAFSPRGFSVSIPDEEGIKLFAFHGKINEEFNGREAGTFARDILKAKNGKWTFIDGETKLKPGDIIHYWTYVDYFDGSNKLGYAKDDQMFVVKELVDKRTGEVVGSQGGGSSSTCGDTPTTVNGKKSCKGKIIFDSTFNNKIDETFWTVQKKYAGGPDYEFVLYDDDPKVIYITDGLLCIKPVFLEEVYGEDFCTKSNGIDLGEKCTGRRGSEECFQKPEGRFILPPFISAQLVTKGKFSFKYGKIEITAKLPTGDWIYPEFYLNSENEEYGPDYQSGQIRVAYTAGNKEMSKRLEGGVILGDSGPARKFGMRNIHNKTLWTDEFHTFGVIWKPDRITMTVDGKIYGNVFAEEGGFASQAGNLQLNYANSWKGGSVMAPYDKEMYLTVGVGVGGHNFEDVSDGSKPWMNKEALAVKNFYLSIPRWRNTWNENSKLQISGIKIWAL